VAEQKLSPVSQPQVDKLEFNEGQPVKFRASFDVLPEFTLANYKSLEIEMPEMNLTEEDVAKALARCSSVRPPSPPLRAAPSRTTILCR